MRIKSFVSPGNLDPLATFSIAAAVVARQAMRPDLQSGRRTFAVHRDEEQGVGHMEVPSTSRATPTRSEERRAFILLAVVLAPVIAVMIVGGFGLVVWVTQIIFGPPGGG